MVRQVLFVTFLGVLTGISSAAETRFPLSGQNTKIEFVGTKPNGKHDGGFKSVTGAITGDVADPSTLKITLEIDMNSTFSDNNKLTAHLKSPDFFGVKSNPKSKFASSRIAKSDGDYEVTGDLTLNAVTKTVTFPAKISASGDALKLESTFKINRHDWNIKYGKGMIDDEVTVKVNVNAKR